MGHRTVWYDPILFDDSSGMCMESNTKLSSCLKIEADISLCIIHFLNVCFLPKKDLKPCSLSIYVLPSIIKSSSFLILFPLSKAPWPLSNTHYILASHRLWRFGVVRVDYETQIPHSNSRDRTTICHELDWSQLQRSRPSNQVSPVPTFVKLCEIAADLIAFNWTTN